MARAYSSILRICLILFVIGLSWYTIRLYASLLGFGSHPTEQDSEPKSVEKQNEKLKEEKIEDPDLLIDDKVIKDAEKEWENAENNLKIPQKLAQSPCDMLTKCDDSEFAFSIKSGSANVIGPSICFDGKWVMKNSLNNVDRGMNIAVINGKTGKTTRKGVFDLYGKDSTDVKAFLKKVEEEELTLVTTYDDAAFKLDDEAREIFRQLGSEKAKTLAFRDNWIFVGGKKLKHPSVFETSMVNDKSKNKFGDWPEPITMEGCIPKLK